MRDGPTDPKNKFDAVASDITLGNRPADERAAAKIQLERNIASLERVRTADVA